VKLAPDVAVVMYCRSRGYPEPVAEHPFHPTRGWRFDLAWPARMVALEFEGVTHAGGRHQRPAGYAEDCRKYTAAAQLGWRLIRVTTTQVRTGEVFPLLDREFGG